MVCSTRADANLQAHRTGAGVGDYRKLAVWQRARAFSVRVREMVNALPPAERNRLGDQLIRAADSIRLNIAEGAGLNSDPQFARHLLIALGSANEAQDALDSLSDNSVLPARYDDLPREATEIRSMIVGLHKKVSPKKNKRPR